MPEAYYKRAFTPTHSATNWCTIYLKVDSGLEKMGNSATLVQGLHMILQRRHIKVNGAEVQYQTQSL